mgnify:CR=1 FL=1
MSNTIHRFKQGDNYIVLDINSGGVHVVDKIVYDILGLLTPPLSADMPEALVKVLTEYPEEELRECYAEIYSLYMDKILFSTDEYRQYAEMSIKAPIKAMCLHVSHDCNLRCKYCFASTGDFGKGRKLMPVETGKKAIDFLLTHSGNRHNLELDFFGGEPLMNFKVVKQIVEYARSREAEYNKKFRFTITTNGLLLDDEKIEFINKEMSNVVLSIDGRKEVNDYFRVLPNGQGCYDMILPKYQKLVAGRGDKEYYVRGTFTNKNTDFANDVFALYEAGFDQISIEPVVGEGDEYALTEKDLSVVFKEYENLANRILENEKNGGKFNFFHFMIDLDQGPCAIKRLRGCGCGNDYVAITPDGDIYPCHQFVGMEEYKMGNIDEGTFNQEMKADFANCHVYSKPECRKCWAKFYCSGGCAANAYHASGSIRGIYEPGCELFKKRIECAIMIKAAEDAEKVKNGKPVYHKVKY